VNGKVLPAKYYCVQVGQNRIEHFSVVDADSVNGMVTHLNPISRSSCKTISRFGLQTSKRQSLD
jgi:hypothetical protein